MITLARAVWGIGDYADAEREAADEGDEDEDRNCRRYCGRCRGASRLKLRGRSIGRGGRQDIFA